MSKLLVPSKYQSNEVAIYTEIFRKSNFNKKKKIEEAYKKLNFKTHNIWPVELPLVKENKTRPPAIALPIVTPTPLTERIFRSVNSTEEVLFLRNGYKKLDVISDTLQGQLYKAECFNANALRKIRIKRHIVAIKKCDKTFQDESLKVSQHLIKERRILEYLTQSNPSETKKDSDYRHLKYIDFIESPQAYYLVLQQMKFERNLKQMVDLSFESMKLGKMDWDYYQRSVRYMFWQLSSAIKYLHHDVNC